MTPNEHQWTQADLERFHDGDLDATASSNLREDLYRDPSLRRRLADIRDGDAAIRAALTVAAPAARSKELTIGRAAAMAASLTIVAAVALFAIRASRKGDVTRSAPLPPVANTDAAPTYEPIRVVLSVPVPENRTRIAKHSQAGGPPTAQHVDDVTRAPVGGHNTLPPAVAYSALGKTLRSAPAAAAFLDELPPSEQLLAARAWAADGSQPAVAFARLQQLSARPELARDVRVVLVELAADARLRPWLRGYRLLGAAPQPETMPSNPS